MIPPPRKVVRVISRLIVGGPAQHVMHLATGLTPAYETLLLTGETDQGEKDLVDTARARGLDVQVIAGLARQIHPISDLRVALRLGALFRDLRPDIVHTHTAKAGTVGRLAAVLAGVPVRVHTFHGHVFHGYFGCLKTAVFLRIERLLALFTTRIVAISKSQADQLVETYRICSREKVCIIPLGLDLERFGVDGSVLRADFRRELGIGNEAVISCVARLAPIKNHALLLDAAARVLATNPNFVFLIVGGGPEEGDLRRRSEALGIARQVRFLGWRTDLERIYAGTDVVVLSSRNEGTPVCLIEAMAAGCSVVATDVGGVRDVVGDSRFATIVPSDDPLALASAIQSQVARTGTDAALRQRHSAAVKRKYHVERLVADTAALYDELLETRRHSG